MVNKDVAKVVGAISSAVYRVFYAYVRITSAFFSRSDAFIVVSYCITRVDVLTTNGKADKHRISVLHSGRNNTPSTVNELSAILSPIIV